MNDEIFFSLIATSPEQAQLCKRVWDYLEEKDRIKIKDMGDFLGYPHNTTGYSCGEMLGAIMRLQTHGYLEVFFRDKPQSYGNCQFYVKRKE